MNKRYISFSEWYTWQYKGFEKYFSSYILGIREMPSEPMLLGSIIHSLLENENYDWKKEIKQLTKFPQTTYERIITKISEEVPRCDERELSLFTEASGKEFHLYAGIDGVQNGVLVEFKTGVSMWTQERVDDNEQINHYCLAWYFKYGKIPPFCLITISTNNGKHQTIPTHRTFEQIMQHYENLKLFKQQLVDKKIWDKKISSRDAITL